MTYFRKTKIGRGDLGVVQWLLGGVMHELVFDGPFAGNKNTRCATLFSRIKLVYETLDVDNRITQLNPGKFCKKPPNFHCFAAKAAESRHLLPVMLVICREESTGSERDEHRIAALEAICEVYNILQTADIVLTDAEVSSAMAQYDTFLLHYNALLQLAVVRGERCYNFVYKHHHFWHLLYHARWINPRAVWCYEFEDFMGVLTKSASNCIYGAPMHIIANKVFENYMMALSLALEGFSA